jgi:hypothetical protein
VNETAIMVAEGLANAVPMWAGIVAVTLVISGIVVGWAVWG